MLNNEKNTDRPGYTPDLDYIIPETLVEEFMEPRKELELVKGLETMFLYYFQNCRYFDDENNTDKVLEAYHFCHYLLSHKELFNPNTVA